MSLLCGSVYQITIVLYCIVMNSCSLIFEQFNLNLRSYLLTYLVLYCIVSMVAWRLLLIGAYAVI